MHYILLLSGCPSGYYAPYVSHEFIVLCPSVLVVMHGKTGINLLVMAVGAAQEVITVDGLGGGGKLHRNSEGAARSGRVKGQPQVQVEIGPY